MLLNASRSVPTARVGSWARRRAAAPIPRPTPASRGEVGSAQAGLQEVAQRSTRPPVPADQGHTAPVTSAASKADGGLEVEHVGNDRPGSDGPTTNSATPLVERSLVAVQRLHHRQIRADEQQEHGLATQQPVTRRAAERPSKASTRCHQVRNCVDHDDAGLIVRQERREQPQRRTPLAWAPLRRTGHGPAGSIRRPPRPVRSVHPSGRDAARRRRQRASGGAPCHLASAAFTRRTGRLP